MAVPGCREQGMRGIFSPSEGHAGLQGSKFWGGGGPRGSLLLRLGPPLSSTPVFSMLAGASSPRCLSHRGAEGSILIVRNGLQHRGRLHRSRDSNAGEDGEMCIGVIRADSFIRADLSSILAKLMPMSFSGVLYLHKTFQGVKCPGVIAPGVIRAWLWLCSGVKCVCPTRCLMLCAGGQDQHQSSKKISAAAGSAFSFFCINHFQLTLLPS